MERLRADWARFEAEWAQPCRVGGVVGDWFWTMPGVGRLVGGLVRAGAVGRRGIERMVRVWVVRLMRRRR